MTLKVALLSLQGVRHPVGEECPVRETGQLVVECTPLQLLLELAPRGRVAERDDDRADVLVREQVAGEAIDHASLSGRVVDATLERHRRTDGQRRQVRELALDRLLLLFPERSSTEVPSSSPAGLPAAPRPRGSRR